MTSVSEQQMEKQKRPIGHPLSWPHDSATSAPTCATSGPGPGSGSGSGVRLEERPEELLGFAPPLGGQGGRAAVEEGDVPGESGGRALEALPGDQL